MDFVNVMVAPLVGAWIEIIIDAFYEVGFVVAPLVGAWIEILNKQKGYELAKCRSSCRSVD